MSTHKDMIEHAADLIMIEVPANIKTRDKFPNRFFLRVGGSFSNGRSHSGGEKMMKRFLMTMVFSAVFMATSALSANDKIYFAVNAGLSNTDHPDSPGLNISFRPEYNVDGALGNEMGRFRAGSVEVDEVNGIISPIDIDLSALTFMPNGYYDIEIASLPITPFIGSGLGLVRSEIDTGTSGSVDKEDLGYQFMTGLGFNVSPTTVLTGEYRFLGIVGSEVHNTHAFIFGARFMFQ